MDCVQAKTLFDAYLDGELSASLATELSAHRLQCSDCRQELALLEVAGHVITADTNFDGVLNAGFTERLLACVETQSSGSPWRWVSRRWVGAAGLAMAAMLAIALFIHSSTPSPQVAGVIVKNPSHAAEKPVDLPTPPDLARMADSIVQQVESTWSTRADSAQSLFEFGQTTILQILDQFGTKESAGADAGAFETMPDSFDELAPPESADGELEEL